MFSIISYLILLFYFYRFDPPIHPTCEISRIIKGKFEGHGNHMERLKALIKMWQTYGLKSFRYSKLQILY